MALSPFFALAMVSPSRQRSFRSAVCLHVGFVALIVAAVVHDARLLPFAGQGLLIAGIVEGAILVGWRLTQIPKSQSLEFLLVSPIQPKKVFYSESAVGAARLTLLALAGLPVLGLLVVSGILGIDDLIVLCAIPLTWGFICGLGITAWAYESHTIRRICEWIGLTAVLIYLLVGVLAAENLRLWVAVLPASVRWFILESYGWVHTCNPFASVQYWLQPHRTLEIALDRLFGLQLVAIGVTGLLLVRGAARLRAHFQDRHYRPFSEYSRVSNSGPGDQPLAWWAVRRVSEYSGRVNFWLAGGFGLLYAAYTVAGDRWPPWMGRLIFQMVESWGGIPVLTAGLVVLAAVPACFQYGLWDASIADRCRRLELLLLTQLDGVNYWVAASAAARRRGCGYFVIAFVLWLAAWISQQTPLSHVLAAAASGVLLWGFAFSLGFRSFARGRQANRLGLLLTLGVPLISVLLVRGNYTSLAAFTPPGSVWHSLVIGPTLPWMVGAATIGGAALLIGARARRSCDRELRWWYDRNHGQHISD